MSDSFEEAAKAFYKATGFLMPGKDGCSRDHEGNLEPEVKEAFKIWCSAVDYMRVRNGSKDKEIQDLEAVVSLAKKALDADTNHFGELETRAEKAEKELEISKNSLSNFKKSWEQQQNELCEERDEAEKESDALKEQLARMGEYVESVQQELIAVDNPVCDQQPLIDDLENALSSYDPKWIEGVRAKAQEEIVDYLTLKFAENGPVGIAHDIRKLWKNLETVRQPNQSREKKG